MKKAKILTLALALGLIFSGCGQQGNASSESGTEQQAEVKTIKAATMGAPIPYITIDENGEVGGYDVSVIKEVFNRLPQYELEIVVTDIGSIFTGISTDVYQIGLNNFSYNEERAKSYLYSYPYDTISYVFVTKDGSVGSFEDAAGKHCSSNPGVSVTVAMEEWNNANPDRTIEIEYIESGTNTAQLVYDGINDFALFDKAMYVEYEKEYNYGLVAIDVPEDEAKTIAANSYTYFLLGLENDSLRQEINAVIKELRDDGTLTRLSEEVFGFDSAPSAEQYEKTPN